MTSSSMTMKKNYNYTRRKLYLPEYGRHIQEMIDSLLEISDRHERTRQAKAVIAVMGNLNPLLRDTEDFKHKLWDHLFIMSDFRLDVNSPYPQPSRQDLIVSPKKLRYPQSRVMFKHYGKYAQKLVRAATTATTADATTQGVANEILNVARFMRAKSYEYNNEHPNNDSIVRDIRLMAGRDVEVDMSLLSAMRNDYRTQRGKQQRGKQQRNGRKQQHNGRKQQRGGAKNSSRHHSYK